MRAPTRTPAVPPPPDPDDPAGAPAPVNRAARRGRARAGGGAVRTGSAVPTRGAQGRRINPVRRTG